MGKIARLHTAAIFIDDFIKLSDIHHIHYIITLNLSNALMSFHLLNAFISLHLLNASISLHLLHYIKFIQFNLLHCKLHILNCFAFIT